MYTYSQSNGRLGSFEQNPMMGFGDLGLCPPWPFTCSPPTVEEYREMDIERGLAPTDESIRAGEAATEEYQRFQQRQEASRARRETNIEERQQRDAAKLKKQQIFVTLAAVGLLGGGAYYFFVARGA